MVILCQSVQAQLAKILQMEADGIIFEQVWTLKEREQPLFLRLC